jgi:hypothetical protein
MRQRWVFGVLLALILAVGLASPGGARAAAAAPARQEECADWITWERARACVGRTTWVAGTVMEVSYAQWEPRWPTTLSLGRASPDRERFDAIIWGTERWKWSPPPEAQYLHRHVCVYGLIALHRGVPEIDVAEPEQLAICE